MAGQLGLYACETCVTDCDNAQAPAFTINNCVDAITLYESEIAYLFFVGVKPDDCTEPVIKPTDWTLAADWVAVLSNTDDNKIRQLNVIGDMPVPDKTETILSLGRKKIGMKTFKLNADLDEFNTVNYTASRKLECGFTGFFWYGTKGGLLFGGPKGIKATVVAADNPKERGGAYEKIILGIEFESKCKPPMIVSPIAQASC